MTLNWIYRSNKGKGCTISKKKIKKLPKGTAHWFDTVVTPSKRNAVREVKVSIIKDPSDKTGKDKLFNLDYLKDKIQDLVKDVEKVERTNKRNECFEDQCKQVDTDWSSEATKSSLHSSAAKKRDNFRRSDILDSYRSIEVPAQRGLSEDTIVKMQEICDQNVKKMYLSKFNKSIKVSVFKCNCWHSQ